MIQNIQFTMGQAIAQRFVQQQAASAASDAAGNVINQAGGSDPAWWCKLLARVAGVLAGIGMYDNQFTCATAVKSFGKSPPSVKRKNK